MIKFSSAMDLGGEFFKRPMALVLLKKVTAMAFSIIYNFSRKANGYFNYDQ
jgi:hypothetical protein